MVSVSLTGACILTLMESREASGKRRSCGCVPSVAPCWLRRLLGQLEAGDVLTVTRLDRLARSARDLLNTLAAITAKKAGFKSLGDTWADTTTSHGRLMLTVLGGLAEFERDLLRTRTSEGHERAKARGVKLGANRN